MSTILRPEDLKIQRQGEGWSETTLADAQVLGAPAMVVRRLSLEPHARGPETVHAEREGLLYVIRGSGVALVGGERLPLEPETLLWLEAGERYHLEADEQGLEVLQGAAPGQ
ncbi:MAG: AraC family ligand binding domain-containing protein [Dehalococcoidia bacterium]